MDSKPDTDDLIIFEIICEGSDSFRHEVAELSGPPVCFMTITSPIVWQKLRKGIQVPAHAR